MKISTLGIYLAKNVFALHGINVVVHYVEDSCAPVIDSNWPIAEL